MQIHTKLVAGLVALAAVAVGTVGVATAVDSEPTAADRAGAVSSGQRAPAERPTSVPAEQSQQFRVLRRSAATSTPDSLKRFAASPDIVGAFAPNLDEARRVASPNATGGDWFVVPVDGGLCLFTGAAGTCANDADARAGELLQMEVSAPASNAPEIPSDGSVPTPGGSVRPRGVQKFRGLAPDGISTVTATSGDGRQTSVEVSADGAYALATEEAARLTLNGEDKQLTIPLR